MFEKVGPVFVQSVAPPTNEESVLIPSVQRIRQQDTAELSPKIRERFDVRWGALGLFVTLVNSKMRDLIPLKRGDIIVQVNQEQVWMTDQLVKIYNKARGQKKKSVIVLVERAGDFKFFFLPVKK